jgi:hypothetical protein
MHALDCLGDGKLILFFARDAMSSIFLKEGWLNVWIGCNNEYQWGEKYIDGPDIPDLFQRATRLQQFSRHPHCTGLASRQYL